ncbi:hypothetical protein B8281_16020 [Cellulosimicrobium sp. TH-20]|uniref:hypothetical protein n=1 Tax=Cellulosimicrobium sp. TH-20 TaxID=1980001 RepID=UPI000A179C07|nr:hypothetical protein [Cellulosimicrobium sp. TH-20]ARK05999.1 hypothetical protein B8281_16020 [Cellulosimicrobium sp. TH-20]
MRIGSIGTESTVERALREYLDAQGWRPSGNPGPYGDLWARPNTSMMIPVPHDIRYGSDEWDSIVGRLADVDRLPPATVAFKITHWSIDVAHARAANDIVIDDTIPLAAGTQLLNSSWRMLRAVATTARGPKPQIKGNYSRLGDLTIAHARMAHTQRGSYVIPILLPLTDVPETKDQHALEGMEHVAPEPEERRVMRTFAESLNMIDRVAVQPDRMPTGEQVMQLVNAGVSREFARALSELLQEDAVSTFSTTFDWAPSIEAPGSVPTAVEIPSAAAEVVERVASRLLSPTKKPGTEVLIGPLIGIRRESDDTFWELQIQAVRHSRPAEIWVTVPMSVGELATEWMRRRETVVVYGNVERGAGNHLRVVRPQSVMPLNESMLSSD